MVKKLTWTQKVQLYDHATALREQGYTLREVGANLHDGGLRAWNDPSRLSVLLRGGRDVLLDKASAERRKAKLPAKSLNLMLPTKPPEKQPKLTANGSGDHKQDVNYWRARREQLRVEELEGKWLDAEEQRKIWLGVHRAIAKQIEQIALRLEQLAPDSPQHVTLAVRRITFDVLTELANLHPKK